MNTPLRWLDAGGDAPLGARELLSVASPTPVFTDEIRYRLALGVAKTASLPVTSIWSSVFVKGAFVTGIGGVVGLVALASVESVEAPDVPAPPQPVAVAAKVEAPSITDTAPPIAVDSLPELQLPTAPDPAPRLKVDARLEEAELLEKARALVGSNPAGALRLTGEHAREFPKGRLGAEADLIAAQALLGMGKISAARQRAQASLSRYPKGLYARQLREIVDAP